MRTPFPGPVPCVPPPRLFPTRKAVPPVRVRHAKGVWQPFNGAGLIAMAARVRVAPRFPRRLIQTGALIISFILLIVPVSSANSAIEGVWLVDPDSAVQIFDCDGLLCGRVVWLRNVRDSTGQIQRDKKNPDPASRRRLVCGMTVLWGLHLAASGKLEGGWFYNPDDGETYSVSAETQSKDLMTARIYRMLPVFGMTKTLRRVPRLSSEGWC